WSEEVKLLREKMRWVLLSLKHKAHWWEMHHTRTEEVDCSLAKGVVAYTDHQALIQQRLADLFKTLWEGMVDTSPEDPD
ncbi:hypothetical protein F5146DRAFT_939073, partial [Armillaria mellea]